MDHETLKLFLDIQTAGTISRAASVNYITQSSASKRIALLEKELGVTLFDRGRGKGSVLLTPAGKSFVDIAERMLLLHRQAMELQVNSERKVFTIACINSVQGYTLPPLIRRFQAFHPSLCVSLEDHHSAEIFPLLLDRRIDIGITQSEAPFLELESELLFEEDYRVVMLPQAEQSCGMGAIHPSGLKPEHEIFEAFDAVLQNWHDHWWRPAASKLRVNTTPTAERYFHDPEDWMIVPETVADAMEHKGFISRSLLEDPPKHRVFITSGKASGGLVQSFLQEARSYFKRL